MRAQVHLRHPELDHPGEQSGAKFRQRAWLGERLRENFGEMGEGEGRRGRGGRGRGEGGGGGGGEGGEGRGAGKTPEPFKPKGFKLGMSQVWRSAS